MSKRVLEVIRQGKVGGGETHVYDLSSRLDQELYKPVVLSFSDGEMVDKLREVNIPVHVIDSTRPFDPRVRKRVEELLTHYGIELIHAHGTRAASNVLHISRALHIPLIYTVHGWSFNDSQSVLKNHLRRRVESYITRRTDLNICVSKDNHSTGRRKLRSFRSRVVNNGISFQRFNPEVDNRIVSDEIGRSEGEIWVGFLARYTFQKNPLSLVRAFKAASDKDSRLRLLMVGSGELKTEVQREIAELGLGEKTFQLPFRDDVPEILKTIDIYCLPSLWEGHPIGLIEAMAMSKACIATRVDGSRELLSHHSGILVEKENEEQLTEAILELASKPELRKSYGENAREMVLEKYSLKNMVYNIEDLYSQLLESENIIDGSATATARPSLQF